MRISVVEIIGATVGLILLASLWLAPWGRQAHPNVLVIFLDSVRADALDAYGSSTSTAPFLHSLAQEGALFTHAYAPAYLTFQSYASALSGLYPAEHNMRTWTTPVASSTRLLPSVLSLYGYDTYAFTSVPMQPHFGLTTAFAHYETFTSTDTVEKSWPRVVDAAKKAKKPFFITWQIYDAHLPYRKAQPPYLSSPYAGMFASTTIRFDWVNQSEGSLPYLRSGRPLGTVSLTNADRTYLRESYETGIRAVDEALRKCFEALKRAHALGDTIVIVTAEHGDDLGEHGFFFHKDLYDVNTRIPFIIWYPRGIQPQVIDTPIDLLDIPPTITSLVGIPIMESGHGIDLAPLMHGASTSMRLLYAEREPFDEYSVISWPWKYILRNSTLQSVGLSPDSANDFFRKMRAHDRMSGHELYNLENDPSEKKNLIGQRLPIESILHKEAVGFRDRMTAARTQNASIPYTNTDVRLVPYP